LFRPGGAWVRHGRLQHQQAAGLQRSTGAELKVLTTHCQPATLLRLQAPALTHPPTRWLA